MRTFFTPRISAVALILCIGIIAGGVLYLKHVEREGTRAVQRTADAVKQFTEDKPAPPVQEGEVPVASLIEKTEPGGHWHGDKWHGGPDAPAHEKNVTSLKTDANAHFEVTSWGEVTLAELMRDWKQGYREIFGEAPSPEALKAAEIEFRDILKSRDEPRVEIVTIQGFAPTKAQLDRYLDLQEQYLDAHSRDAHAEADALQARMFAIEEAAVGDVPAVSVSWQSEKAKSKAKQVLAERTEQAYREYGLGHLVEAGMTGGRIIRPTQSQ